MIHGIAAANYHQHIGPIENYNKRPKHNYSVTRINPQTIKIYTLDNKWEMSIAKHKVNDYVLRLFIANALVFDIYYQKCRANDINAAIKDVVTNYENYKM